MENLVNHLGNFWLYSGYTLLNYPVTLTNFIITNNSQVQSYIIESGNNFGTLHYYFNVLVTDNTL